MSVARRTQRDQIQLGIVSGVAAKLPVMNLQIRYRRLKLTGYSITEYIWYIPKLPNSADDKLDF